MAGIAPDVPYEILDASSLIAAPLAGRRFAVIVVAGFGLLTLLLAAVGIHGVVTWSVRQRSREMGIRIALGAVPSGVALRVVAEAMQVVGAGVVIGLAGAIASTRLIGGLLIGTSPLQPVTLAIAVLLLGAVALAASGIPALHVARIDPLTSLRS
jgi:ABC-type antimicrobial peptide transport system permease subunit